jgi:hypothetical protein
MRAGAADNLGSLYRPPSDEELNEAREVDDVWEANGQAWVRFLPAQNRLRDEGAGEERRGERTIEVHGHVDLQERDGLAVTYGPMAGTRWRVVSVDAASRGVRVAAVEVWRGEFTT